MSQVRISEMGVNAFIENIMTNCRDVPVRVVAVRVVACCVLGQPVRVELLLRVGIARPCCVLRVACWVSRSVLSCFVLRVGIAGPC